MQFISPPDLPAWLDAETRNKRLDSYRRSIKDAATVAVNLGCGEHPKEGYLNCDLHNPNAELQVDIRLVSSKLSSADLIESHHALEHLSFEDSLLALQDWVNILNTGGYLIISVPDFEECLKKFLATPEETKWTHVIKMIYGSQEHEGMYHKTGFTPARLEHALDKLGVNCVVTVTSYPVRPTPSFIYIGIKA